MTEHGSRVVISLPLWQVLEYGEGYLKHAIDKAANELGLATVRHPATSFGPVMATVEIRLSQKWIGEP